VGKHRHGLRTLVAGTAALYIAAVGIGSVFSVTAAAETGRADAAQPTREVRIPIDAALISRTRVEQERALRAEQGRRAAEYLAALAEYYRPKTGVNWDGIARCETGGNWRMQGPRFSGGLGFYNGTWTSFGGREFAPNAGMATREQQIVVAERVHARHGLSGWGCRAYG
jgi:hypothetical protein